MDSSATIYSDAMKDERHTTGSLRMWEGIRLLEIPNSFKPQTYDFKISDKKLFVLPNAFTPIKLVFEGDTQADSVTTNTGNRDMTLEYSFATKVGIGVVLNKLYGTYTLE